MYKYDGYFACISSFADYYTASMDLIKSPEARASLFEVKNRPVLTKVRNSAPTYYSADSDVKNFAYCGRLQDIRSRRKQHPFSAE